MAGNRKQSFISSIFFWSIGIFIVFSCIVTVIDLVDYYGYFDKRIDNVKSDFIKSQRLAIKQNVYHVVSIINSEDARIKTVINSTVKSRVGEAYAVALNIYNRNRNTKSRQEIQSMIIDALKPVRYENGTGYYFITGMDGREILSLGKSQADSDSVISGMINLIKEEGEGYYKYSWPKPGGGGVLYKKLSYIKLFEPYGFFIGTGLYMDDVETSFHKFITDYVEKYRFGPGSTGYVFIIRLLDIAGGDRFGIMYANPNRPDLVGKYLSDEFEDAKGKKFRKEFLRGLREKGECYVDYWYRKINDPEPGPKTSFFKLTDDGRYVVAAGVYMDDIEKTIVQMKRELIRQMKIRIFRFMAAIIIVLLIFVAFLKKMSRKLKQDFTLFSSFLDSAAFMNRKIDLDKVQSSEFVVLAERANKMLEDKILAQKALKVEKELLFVTIRSIGDGVITTDISGNVVLMNSVAEVLTGWKWEDAKGRNLGEVFRIVDRYSRSPVPNPVSLVLEAGKRIDLKENTVLVSKDGKEFYIADSAAPILDSGDEVIGVVLVFRDDTEKIRMQNEFFKIKKLESVGLLAGGIAHDFNNILTGIFGNIELARMNSYGNEKVLPYLDNAAGSIERATYLTNQLLTFAKGGSPIIEKVDLKSIIEEMVRFNLTGSSVKAVFDIPDDLWQVKADKGQLEQVVANLVINAKQAMPEGGMLNIRVENIDGKCGEPCFRYEGKYVELTFADTGKGIPSVDMDKVFDPYFTTKHTGSGLGLATVHSIVAKHKGFIHVRNGKEGGAVFTLYLPADAGGPESGPSYSGGLRVSGMDIRRVLIMDDEESVREVGRNMLETIYGCRVDFASDGKEAVDKVERRAAENEPYDLIIMDLTIPGGLGGREAAGIILNAAPDIKIIVSSGYSTDPVMSEFRKYGFSSRLVKPFQIHDLKRAVESCFG